MAREQRPAWRSRRYTFTDGHRGDSSHVRTSPRSYGLGIPLADGQVVSRDRAAAVLRIYRRAAARWPERYQLAREA